MTGSAFPPHDATSSVDGGHGKRLRLQQKVVRGEKQTVLDVDGDGEFSFVKGGISVLVDAHGRLGTLIDDDQIRWVDAQRAEIELVLTYGKILDDILYAAANDAALVEALVEEDVCAGSTGQRVAADAYASDQRIVAPAAGERVFAGAAIEPVGAVIARERIGEARAEQVFESGQGVALGVATGAGAASLNQSNADDETERSEIDVHAGGRAAIACRINARTA